MTTARLVSFDDEKKLEKFYDFVYGEKHILNNTAHHDWQFLSNPYNSLNTKSIVVAEDNDQLIAHMGLIPVPVKIYNEIKLCAWHVSFFTLEEFRGMGLGTKMIQFSDSIFDGVGAMGSSDSARRIHIKNGGKNSVIGFDTGPGMCLIDLYVKTYWNQQYDIDGSLASKGNIDELMLDYLMKDKFVIKSYPKSASTEMYDYIYLSKIEKKFPNIKRYNFLRTLVNFTSISIIDNIKRINIYPELSDMKIIMSGGGVKNKILFSDINRGLINNRIVLMDYDGLNVDNKESFLMCLLGYTRYFNIPNNVPSVTGANKDIVCGEIYE